MKPLNVLQPQVSDHSKFLEVQGGSYNHGIIGLKGLKVKILQHQGGAEQYVP
jgi:hypothetical protein